MSSSFFKLYIIIFIFITLFISIFFVPVISSNSNLLQDIPILYSLNGNFQWPAPGYTRITSPFGYRVSPTSGASTYHSGIDIGAPAGSNIISAFSGKVTLTEFKGAGRIYNHRGK